MNQEKKAKLAPQIKDVLKRYRMKGSIGVSNNSTLVVTIKSGNIDFFGNYNKMTRKANGNDADVRTAEDYMDINPYWYDTHFDGIARDFLDELFDAMKGTIWYDNSDIQSDYFNTAYYVDVNIGRWNKPYELVK